MQKPTWNDHELEHLIKCPLCNSGNRYLAYAGVPDRIAGTEGLWNYHECSDCGAVYVDPRPNESSIVRAYENYFTHDASVQRARTGRLDRLALGIRNSYLNRKYGYTETPEYSGGYWLMHLLPPWLRLEWDHNARHLGRPTARGNRLLDVGCGNGEFIASAKRRGWEVCGLDFDPQAIKTAQSLGIDARRGVLAEQHFPSNHFDAITLSHVIEHVHNPRNLLAECARLLKPGGVLWIATPNASSITRRHFGYFWFDFCAPQHLVLFSPASMRRLLEECGLSPQFKQRGAHIEAHWNASKKLTEGKTGADAVYTSSFLGKKSSLRFAVLECLFLLLPFLQGDLVAKATKPTIRAAGATKGNT